MRLPPLGRKEGRRVPHLLNEVEEVEVVGGGCDCGEGEEEKEGREPWQLHVWSEGMRDSLDVLAYI